MPLVIIGTVLAIVSQISNKVKIDKIKASQEYEFYLYGKSGENYNYLGGLCNKSNYEYESYNKALKNSMFDNIGNKDDKLRR